MDSGIGYLVVFNRYFGGYEAGPRYQSNVLKLPHLRITLKTLTTLITFYNPQLSHNSSTSEMATTNVPDVGDGVSSEYILSISTVFSSYNDGAGASRMIVYATSGHSTGIESASTYR